MCGSTKGLQTHHIKEQNLADENGFIGDYHKNSIFNLIVLCDKCHKDLHSQGLEIVPCQMLNQVTYKITK